MVICLQLAVVHTIDDRLVGPFGRGGNQNPLGAARQVDGGLVTVIELAGAFEDDIDAVPVQFIWVVGRHDLDGSAAEVEHIARDLHRTGETSMDRVVFQQMGVGLDRAGGVDLDDLNVIACGFRDMGQRAAPDAPEAVDADRDRHMRLLSDEAAFRGRANSTPNSKMKVLIKHINSIC